MSDAPMMFDDLPSDPVQAQPEAHATQPEVLGEQPGQMPSFDDMVSDEDKYGTPGQQLKAGAEGLAKGVAGPLAPYLEKKLLRVPYSEQKAREEANPVTHAVGQGIGLVGGALTGVGEGALMAKAGQAVAEGVGLANAASVSAKIGSEAVKQAVEMAVLQSGDEVGKLIMSNPDASAESAIANIGMASAFGAAGGALMGSVSPLWKATVGTKVENALSTIKDHLDGTVSLALPEAVENASKTLGLNLNPELKAAMSGNAKAAQMFNELREAQHPGVQLGLKTLENDVNTAVLNSLGRSTEDIANYSEAEGGKHAMDTFVKEYKSRIEPISKEFDEVTGPFKQANVSAAEKGTLAERITQLAQEKGYLGAELPQNKIIDAILTQLPNVKTVDDFAKLNTRISNMTKGDFALTQVSRDMKGLINDAQSSAMAQAIGKDAPELMSRYAAVRSAYADIAKTSEQLGGELGLGKFVGPKSLLAKMSEKRSPEEFLRRLSPKGNAEILEFLGKNFPNTLESIRENELKQLLRPAVLGAKGESLLNSKILNNAIEKGMAGQKERIQFALPQGALEKIQAAKTIMEAIPGMKSSGTAGWHQKMMAHVPESAMAGIALLTGHNPIFGAITGHVSKLLARDVPDAMKLGMLKFLASDQPIKSEGFKSMIEFVANTAKGQTVLNKATSNVFKSGAQVLTTAQMPDKADREKLDKIVSKMQKNPETLMKLTDSHVGHYLPAQQAALTASQVRAIQYLQSIKPQPFQASPLDKPIEPSEAEQARYDRALDIANQPNIVLHHIKEGTLQMNDMKDINAMYPALTKQMQQKLSNQMINTHSDEEPISYHTKMGISLFLGQPVDSTMTPNGIMSAQPIPQAPQNNPPAAKTNKLGKSNNNYMTPNQSSESRRANND